MYAVLPSRSSWPLLGVFLGTWATACVAGWAVWSRVTGPSPSGVGEVLGWTASAAVVLLLGGALGAVVDRSALRPRIGRPERLALATGVGWGVANSAGWTLDVEIGGPMTGLVTGVALAAALSGVPVGRAAAVGAIGITGPALGRLVTGDLPPVPGLGVSLLCGLVAVLVARRLIAPTLPLHPVLVLTVAGGAAWVGAFVLVVGVVPASMAAVSNVAEILLAISLGALALGIELRGRSAGSPAATVLRWVVAATIGLVLGVAIAVTLAAVAGGGGPTTYLGVGMNLGLGTAAWLAVLPAMVTVTVGGRSTTTQGTGGS